MVNRVVWQFSTHADPLSFVIRYGTRSDFSHVDAVLPDGSLLGARLCGGVKIRPAGYLNFTKTLRVAIETPLADEIYANLYSQLGKPYDWRAATAFAAGDRDWRDTDAWFCSELQIWAVEKAGFFMQDLQISTDRLSPRDQLLLFSPWIELIQ